MIQDIPDIWVKSIVKNYGKKQVSKNISLEIFPGSIVSLLGANGAGKTTLIKMMLGLEVPTSGKIYLNGLNPVNPRSRFNVGVVPQTSRYIDELTARETIRLVSKHYSQIIPMQQLIEYFLLDEFIDKRTGILSEGQKRRLALALAFVGNPKIVFLDEPTVGLDVQSRLALWAFIKSFRQPNTTIFLTTHYLEEAQALADRIIMLREGAIIADGSVDDIRKKYSQSRISFKLFEETSWILLRNDIETINSEIYHIQTDDPDAVIREMVRENVPFYDIQVSKSSLEDVFIKLSEV